MFLQHCWSLTNKIICSLEKSCNLFVLMGKCTSLIVFFGVTAIIWKKKGKGKDSVFCCTSPETALYFLGYCNEVKTSTQEDAANKCANRSHLPLPARTWWMNSHCLSPCITPGWKGQRPIKKKWGSPADCAPVGGRAWLLGPLVYHIVAVKAAGLKLGGPCSPLRQEGSNSAQQYMEVCVVGDPWVSQGMCRLDPACCLDKLCAG